MTIKGLFGSSRQVSFGFSKVLGADVLSRTRCSPSENTVSPSRIGPGGASEYKTSGAPKMTATASPIDHSGGSELWVGSDLDDTRVS